MAITQKNYRAFAEEIKLSIARDVGEGGGGQEIASVARRIADVMKADNPRFRYDTFFEACGLDSYGYPVKGD